MITKAISVTGQIIEEIDKRSWVIDKRNFLFLTGRFLPDIVSTLKSADPNCGLFSNGFEDYEVIGYIKPDLVFLDIEMTGINRIELLRKIRASVPMTVFITSFTEL